MNDQRDDRGERVEREEPAEIGRGPDFLVEREVKRVERRTLDQRDHEHGPAPLSGSHNTRPVTMVHSP